MIQVALSEDSSRMNVNKETQGEGGYGKVLYEDENILTGHL